jgi:hypothetical protein
VSRAALQIQGHITKHLTGGIFIPGANGGVKRKERPEIEGHLLLLRFPSLP